MKLYEIYTSPLGKVEAVKQGWSWPAFFFSWIWACVKGMWVLGIGIIVALLVVLFIFEVMSIDEMTINGFFIFADVVIGIIFGVRGNSWREKNLLSRGFSLAATENAANPEAALALHASSAQ
jgi:hypothetical protein